MKQLFLIIPLLLNTAFATTQTPTVLLVFDDLQATNITADLTALGVELAWKHGGKGTPKLIRIKLDSNLKLQTERLNAAITEHKPVAIIGAVTSNVALTISEVAEGTKTVFITPFATHPKVTQGKTYTFRTCFSDDYQASTLARFIHEVRQLRRGVILYNRNQSYAVGVRDVFKRVFLGLKNAKIEDIPIESEKSITPELLATVKSLNPDFIIIPSYQTEAAAILSQIVPQVSEKVEFFGTDSWGGGRLFNQILDNRLHTFNAFYVQHWSQDYDSPKNRRLASILNGSDIPPHLKFKGTAMNAPIAMGYEAGTTFLNAYSILKKKKTALAPIMEETTFDGLSGSFTLKNDHTPDRGLFIYRINSKSEALERMYR